MAVVRGGMTMSFDYTEALISRDPVIVRRKVLWGDCDPAGVVYTPRFADYVVTARDWFFREGLGLIDRPHPSRKMITYPMRALTFDFSGFLAADDFFDMTVSIADISRRTFTTAVTATHADRPEERCFIARLTAICFDQETGKSMPLPDSVRAKLESHLQSAAPVERG